MWKRKSDAEIGTVEKRRRWSESRFNPARPAALALATAAIWTLFLWTGYRKNGVWLVSPEPFREAAPAFPVLAGIVFVVCYFIYIVTDGLRMFRPVAPRVICNRCHELRTQQAGESCPCGGQFELLEHWTLSNDEGNPKTHA